MITHHTEDNPIRMESVAICGSSGWVSITSGWSNVNCINCLKHRAEYPFLVNCGGLETMEKLAAHGRKALNPKTHKWQIISKSAKYKVVEGESIQSEEYGLQRTANLYCNEDLVAIAKAKGLVF